MPTAVRVERIDSDLTSEPADDVAGYYNLYDYVINAICFTSTKLGFPAVKYYG